VKKLLSIGAMVLAAAQPAFAQQTTFEQQAAGLDEAVREFAATCLMHVFSHTDLHAKFDHSTTALAYSDSQAGPFLNGTTGSVWGLRGRASNYAVALTDNGICSLNAQSHVPGVWNDFDALLRMLFPGAKLVPVNQELAGPTTALVQSKGYRLQVDGRLLPAVFTAVKSSDPRVNFADRLTIFVPPGSMPQPIAPSPSSSE
jgi:hypothetical protein